VRALRFQRLNRQDKSSVAAKPPFAGKPPIAGNPPFADMLRLVLASSLGSQLLPLKLGEFAYIYLLKRSRRASIPQGLSSLLAARLFDLLAIAALFILVSLALGLAAQEQLAIYFNAILIFIAALMGVILFLLIGSRYAGRLLDWFFELPFLRAHPTPFLGKLRAALQDLLHELARYSPRDMFEWGALAGLEWFINYYAFHVLLLGIGMTPRFIDTVVCVTFAALASVLPLNSFGSFGTQEAGWAAGLLLMGFSRENAISSGFATHLLTLAYMLVLGGISWLSYLLPERADKAQV
jgi:uncharacterized protein (TIRG00374 family)